MTMTKECRFSEEFSRAIHEESIARSEVWEKISDLKNISQKITKEIEKVHASVITSLKKTSESFGEILNSSLEKNNLLQKVSEVETTSLSVENATCSLYVFSCCNILEMIKKIEQLCTETNSAIIRMVEKSKKTKNITDRQLIDEIKKSLNSEVGDNFSPTQNC